MFWFLCKWKTLFKRRHYFLSKSSGLVMMTGRCSCISTCLDWYTNMFSDVRWHSDIKHDIQAETRNILWVMMTFQKQFQTTVSGCYSMQDTLQTNTRVWISRILFQNPFQNVSRDAPVPQQHGRWWTSWKVTSRFWSQCVKSKSKACWMSSHLTMQQPRAFGSELTQLPGESVLAGPLP